MTNAMNSLVKDPKSNQNINMDNTNRKYSDKRHSPWILLLIVSFSLNMALLYCVIDLGFSCANQPSVQELTLTLEQAPSQALTLYEWDNRLERYEISPYREALFTPQQIHLSLGVNYTERYVSWSTLEQPSSCGMTYLEVCQGEPKREFVVSAKMRFDVLEDTDPDWVKISGHESRAFYNYHAKFNNLLIGCQYYYRIITTDNEKHEYNSRVYTFKMEIDMTAPDATVNLAMFGDLGLVNGQSINPLIQSVDRNEFDLIIHNGDFAYDLDSKHGQVGDEFMRKIEPIAARVPYQTTVGNHEIRNNFSFYEMRFNMINSGGLDEHNGERNNFYYSFNVGPIHFVAFSTEFYYFIEWTGIEPLHLQYEWLKKDLSHASSPEERAQRPWIVVLGHRPMYCSSRSGDDCSKRNNILRKGLPFLHSYALEKLFYDFGVDVEFYSHEHMYERFLPLYNGQVFNGTEDENNPYYNPKAPVHIISGSAGCNEKLDPFSGTPVAGSVKQISDYGFTVLNASRCKLEFEQKSIVQQNWDSPKRERTSLRVDDRFVIYKTKQNFPSESDIDLKC